MYEEFACVYDEMMDHIPYREWFVRLRDYLAGAGVSGGTLCELGCGTGTMSELFAEAGYQVTGVDMSEDMLALAQEKKEKSGSGILYLHQDMEELELAEPVDVMISVCDSMNYILEETALDKVFTGVRKYLRQDGYFIFDMKTIYCYRNIIGDRTWAGQDDRIGYIWENYFYEDEKIHEYLVTIFQRQREGGLYERIQETHYQRAYGLDELTRCLERNGLAVVDCFGEDMKSRPTEESGRIYIVAQRRR